jgi:hypothetical protein
MQDEVIDTDNDENQPKRYLCRHIFTDGHRCGSICLRGEHFCYYHHTTRRPAANPKQRKSHRTTFELPLPEDRSAIQASIGMVLQRIAANDIDPAAPACSSTASLSPPPTSPKPRPGLRPSPAIAATQSPSKSKRSPPTPTSAPSPHSPNSTHPKNASAWPATSSPNSAENPAPASKNPTPNKTNQQLN